MKLSKFDYNLPRKYIAQTPIEPRDHSKLMVVRRDTGLIEHRHFFDIGEYLKKGDILAANNSKVMAARLFGKKSTGAKVELLLLHQKTKKRWQVLAKPAKRLRQGDVVYIESEKNKIEIKIAKELSEGMRLIEFGEDITGKLDEIGIVPLPPYIDASKFNDKDLKSCGFEERYQTVYSKIIGSAAAPTAGLHFTPELIKNLKNKGVDFKYTTLHIGLDTFRPMSVQNIEDHKIHSEYCVLTSQAAKDFNIAKQEKRRIIAVGTTATRVLETAFDKNKNKFYPFNGWTDIFIYPGYRFNAIDGLITNFHLPKSSLLLMISAFAGSELILKAYKEAKTKNYRFFSFGDAMLIL